MIMEITDHPEILQHRREIHAVGVCTLQVIKTLLRNPKLGEMVRHLFQWIKMENVVNLRKPHPVSV